MKICWEKIICKKQLEGKDLICYNYVVAVGSFSSAGKEYTMGKNLKGRECGNDLVYKHPMGGVRYAKPVRAADDIHVFTRSG